MTKRRTLTPNQKRDLLHACRHICTYCKQSIRGKDQIEYDHVLALGRGGADVLDNLAPIHQECHKLKTFGRKATTLGSDIFEIAKGKRIARKRLAPKAPKFNWPTRKIPQRVNPWN